MYTGGCLVYYLGGCEGWRCEEEEEVEEREELLFECRILVCLRSNANWIRETKQTDRQYKLHSQFSLKLLLEEIKCKIGESPFDEVMITSSALLFMMMAFRCASASRD